VRPTADINANSFLGRKQEENHAGFDLYDSDEEAKDVLLPGVAGAQGGLQAICQPLLLLRC
jgi:hypothetical protein